MDSPRGDNNNNNNEILSGFQQLLEGNMKLTQQVTQLLSRPINHNEVSSRLPQILESQSQLMHDMNHVVKDNNNPPSACKICGDMGHTYKEHQDQCPNCDVHHPDSQCPTSLVNCFLCEGIDHVPAQCPLYPIVQQIKRDGVHQVLEKNGDGARPMKEVETIVILQQAAQNITNKPDFTGGKRKYFSPNHSKKQEKFPEYVIEYTEQGLNDLLALERPKKKKKNARPRRVKVSIAQKPMGISTQL